MAEVQQPFLTDITEIRRRAREHLEEGAITEDYEGDVNATVKLLNDALATEIVCVLRYTYHYVAAVGLQSEAVKEEFGAHAREEQEHALRIAERINQLGGKPDFNPEGLLSRSASQYAEGVNLVDMIKENLIAERIAIQTYQEMVRYFANHDPTTRRMMEDILAKEEEHANDMHDLLVAHQGKPPLRS
ncbi:Bacterioferritin [Myxococcus hansupus]|uniref:Bacterioferritin n=1 Tax=Pseudomyxococcus hansupus TaxID=1297742 RepID=A0A0H4X0V2_9BACT|nr:ferritin-like domain-containing protein [Myxococcus hansupus]AKQ67225.1 Bacterioferritin [Myxococcus hansupus]